MAFAMCMMLVALTMAAPAQEELVFGNEPGVQENINPQDPQELIFKLKKIKKILFG